MTVLTVYGVSYEDQQHTKQQYVEINVPHAHAHRLVIIMFAILCVYLSMPIDAVLVTTGWHSMKRGVSMIWLGCGPQTRRGANACPRAIAMEHSSVQLRTATSCGKGLWAL